MIYVKIRKIVIIKKYILHYKSLGIISYSDLTIDNKDVIHKGRVFNYLQTFSIINPHWQIDLLYTTCKIIKVSLDIRSTFSVYYFFGGLYFLS